MIIKRGKGIEDKRKKMIRTKYGQAPLKHAKKGIYSCLYAAGVFVLLLLMLIAAFVKKGDVSVLYGAGGLLALALAFAGLFSGVKGCRERDKNYITCRIGIIVNALFLLGLAAIFIRGLL